MTEAITPLLVSIQDTATLLGISQKTIRNQVSLGKFPISPVRIGGRTLFRVAEIHDFAATSKAVSGTVPSNERHRGRPRKIVANTGTGGAL